MFDPSAASRTSRANRLWTGIGLALLAAARGYGLVRVMPEKMSHDKRAALAAPVRRS